MRRIVPSNRRLRFDGTLPAQRRAYLCDHRLDAPNPRVATALNRLFQEWGDRYTATAHDFVISLSSRVALVLGVRNAPARATKETVVMANCRRHGGI
jgi:hypothetical protein